VVRCTRGCDWIEKTIACPAAQDSCYAIVASSDIVDGVDQLQQRQREVRPLAGSVCLGIVTISDPKPLPGPQTCEESMDEHGNSQTSCTDEEVPAPNTRVIVRQVVEGSPAQQSGFKAGDVIVALNGVPVRGNTELHNAVQRLVAGQSFDASLKRGDTLVSARGRLGFAMSDNSCAVADEKLMHARALTAQDLEPAPFLVEFHGVPSGGIGVQCLQGCGWAIKGGTPGSSSTLTVTFDQNGLSSVEENPPRR
jgi:predicted metalloprotease with PDZ domain